MIITNRYWLEEQGIACFPSRVERSTHPVRPAVRKCTPMDADSGSPFWWMGERYFS